MFEKAEVVTFEFEDKWGREHTVCVDKQTGYVLKQDTSTIQALAIIFEMRRILRRNQAITFPQARRAAEAACNWKSAVQREQRWNEQDLPGMFQGRIVEMRRRRDDGAKDWYWDAFPMASQYFQEKEWGA